jgi:hypothetical protein
LARYYYTCIAQQLQFLVKSHAASISDELALATFTQNLGHARWAMGFGRTDLDKRELAYSGNSKPIMQLW